jgi:hypothetical protein
MDASDVSDELSALNKQLHEVEVEFIRKRMSVIRTFLAGKSEQEQLAALGDEKTHFEGSYILQALAHSPYPSVHDALMESAGIDLHTLVTLARQSPSSTINDWAEAEIAIMLPGDIAEYLDTAFNG